MPDAADVEVMVSATAGQWDGQRLTGPARLRLTSDAVLLDASQGASLRARYADLHGAVWRTGALTIHAAAGAATVESPRTGAGLEQAWTTIIARACPVPEVARGHRRLGSRRGGHAAAQARFFAPLLQARRTLEEQPDLEVRVAGFDARLLRERIDSALAAIARDAYPASAPDRRALEAELEESMAPLFAALDGLSRAAGDFRAADEPVRFMAWRRWVAAAGSVFARADSAWSHAARLLPEQP